MPGLGALMIRIASGVTEPYNSVLSSHALLEHADVCMTFGKSSERRCKSGRIGSSQPIAEQLLCGNSTQISVRLEFAFEKGSEPCRVSMVKI